MTTKIMKAAVQYGDWDGTSAADDADLDGINKWLEVKGHKKSDEYVVGVELWAGENHGKHRDPVWVNFLLTTLGGHDNIPDRIRASGGILDVKKVSVEMPLVEFFGMFKRLAVSFSLHGMLEECEVRYAGE